MCRYLSLCLLTALGGLVPDVALLDPVVILCLMFLGTTRLFLQRRRRRVFPPALRERAGFSRSEVGPCPVSASQRGGGGGEAACAHTACRPSPSPTACRSASPNADANAEEVQRLGDAVQGTARFKPRPSASQLMLLNILALISLYVFFPAFLNLCCKMFSYLNYLSGCMQYV